MRAMSIGALMLTLCSPALAEIKVCNDYADAVYVVIGWVEDGDTRTKGWWRIPTGQCQVVDQRPLRHPHYIHAETDWVVSGTEKKQMRWGGNVTLAIDSKKFDYVHSQNLASDDLRGNFLDLSQGETGFTNVTWHLKADGGSERIFALDQPKPAAAAPLPAGPVSPEKQKKATEELLNQFVPGASEMQATLMHDLERKAGLDAYKRGQYQEALTHFNKVLAGKTDASDYYNRGMVYYDLKQYQNAIEDFEHANRIDPKYSDAQRMWRVAVEALRHEQGVRVVK